ncbi:MAG: hypothetical protein ACE5F1_20425, partial [Planctomycetota bacterium]
VRSDFAVLVLIGILVGLGSGLAGIALHLGIRYFSVGAFGTSGTVQMPVLPRRSGSELEAGVPRDFCDIRKRAAGLSFVEDAFELSILPSDHDYVFCVRETV